MSVMAVTHSCGTERASTRKNSEEPASANSAKLKEMSVDESEYKK